MYPARWAAVNAGEALTRLAYRLATPSHEWERVGVLCLWVGLRDVGRP
jgi:hypothetical protein